MEQHILKIVMEYRWHHKKGITIFNATEVSLQQKFDVCITKMYFKKLRKDENNERISKITFFWVFKMSSTYLFRAALSEPKFVLDKNSLFHWTLVTFCIEL